LLLIAFLTSPHPFSKMPFLAWGISITEIAFQLDPIKCDFEKLITHLQLEKLYSKFVVL